MSKFKKGDFVVWKPANKDISPIYAEVDAVIEVPGIDENYILCSRGMTCNGKPFRDSFEFWEHELELVDMKGANI